jgi:RNA polymerase-binding transcription factor DksA
MKILKSMPNDTAFFERYADLTHSLTKVATIAQVVTAAAEIGILYALLYPSVKDLFPSQAATIATCGAVFCAALLQFGLKKVFPYSVRAFIYNRWKGLDCAFSVSVIILTIALLAVSVFLSYNGSKDIAAFAVTPPTEKTTTAQDSAKRTATAQANSLFSSDSSTIETKYKGKAEALTAEFNSRISASESKASQTVNSAPSWSKSLRLQAATLRGEMATKLATLQADKATELQAKAEKRQSDIDKATNRADSQADAILSENKAAKDAAKVKAESYSGYIGYFCVFCYVFFLFTYILNEIYHKGAKIDLTPVPSQRHFNPSVIAEWIEALKERIDVNLRTKVYNFANETKAQPLPDAVRSLYDFKANTFGEVLQVESDFEKMKVVKLPTKRHKIAATVKDDTTKKADDTPSKVRVIGFKKQDDTTDDATEKREDTKVHNDFRPTANLSDDTKTIVVTGGDFGKCENCGNDFYRNHKKQRFCGEDCRKDAWKNKTGRDFDLSVKNKERRKK